jgi:hypothetical protein
MNGGPTHEPENAIAAIIDAAEDAGDPLEGLVERTRTDPGAPFMIEALERLAALKKEDRPAFERLRKRLKEERCRVTVLDVAIAEKSGDLEGRGPTQADILVDPTQADILVDLAQPAELFHAPDGTAFADLHINGHRETWPIKSKGCRRWLTHRYYEERHGAPSSEALQAAINLIEARAQFDGPERMVHIRVGGFEGRLYLDLCDDTWSAIEIDEDGWRIEDEPPIRFRRTAGMRPLPIPVPGGSINALRPFLNVHTDADFVLSVGWSLAALRGRGPYPVLVLAGEHGSAKSTFSSILRKLVDPNTAPLRALSREDRELFIAANNCHVLTFDNVSGLPGWTSDTLCRIATGGGFAVRQLYTDQEEVLFDVVRPVILNGIEDIVNRPDLADRSLFLNLEPIPEDALKLAQQLDRAIERMNAISEGPRQSANVEAARLAGSMSRLMLTFQQGALTLERMRSGGRQIVTVQHVTVNDGGQAVVAGNVASQGQQGGIGGKGHENGQ